MRRCNLVWNRNPQNKRKIQRACVQTKQQIQRDGGQLCTGIPPSHINCCQKFFNDESQDGQMILMQTSLPNNKVKSLYLNSTMTCSANSMYWHVLSRQNHTLSTINYAGKLSNKSIISLLYLQAHDVAIWRKCQLSSHSQTELWKQTDIAPPNELPSRL